ncbi:helix-turn-helix transcriptional regulator [uncultured Clostridium sp.]|uniref:ArsR/SmtB family transcription factor n=1 Tax=uncultured Clostridium sp. TaxID=59620 RepID=UPI0025F34816|nr:metalloregulator ArsR/SmtB family transcription factor [uncultured Clostridium sp.]
MEDIYEANAKVFKAFCDEKRLRILEMLQSGEKCACHLLDKMDIGQSTLSHHMKILCESGVVQGRKEGKWTYYSISSEGSESAQKLLKKLLEVNTGINIRDDKCLI